MIRIPNINCQQYNKGRCNDLSRMGNGCVELSGEICDVREPHPKPPAPPPPPPKRIIYEDVKIQPLTEGKTRGSAMKKTYSRSVHPPMPGKKDTIQDEILKKVRKREFRSRCIAVDICPKCGYNLRKVGKYIKECDKCNIIF